MEEREVGAFSWAKEHKDTKKRGAASEPKAFPRTWSLRAFEPRLARLSPTGLHSHGEQAGEDTMHSLDSGLARAIKNLGRSRQMTPKSWGGANRGFEKW